MIPHVIPIALGIVFALLLMEVAGFTASNIHRPSWLTGNLNGKAIFFVLLIVLGSIMVFSFLLPEVLPRAYGNMTSVPFVYTGFIVCIIVGGILMSDNSFKRVGKFFMACGMIVLIAAWIGVFGTYTNPNRSMTTITHEKLILLEDLPFKSTVPLEQIQEAKEIIKSTDTKYDHVDRMSYLNFLKATGLYEIELRERKTRVFLFFWPRIRRDNVAGWHYGGYSDAKVKATLDSTTGNLDIVNAHGRRKNPYYLYLFRSK